MSNTNIEQFFETPPPPPCGYKEIDGHETIVIKNRVHYSQGLLLPIGFTPLDYKKLRIDIYDAASSNADGDQYRVKSAMSLMQRLKPIEDIEYALTGNFYQPETSNGKFTIGMKLNKTTSNIEFFFRHRGSSVSYIYLSLRIYEIE